MFLFGSAFSGAFCALEFVGRRSTAQWVSSGGVVGLCCVWVEHQYCRKDSSKSEFGIGVNDSMGAMWYFKICNCVSKFYHATRRVGRCESEWEEWVNVGSTAARFQIQRHYLECLWVIIFFRYLELLGICNDDSNTRSIPEFLVWGMDLGMYCKWWEWGGDTYGQLRVLCTTITVWQPYSTNESIGPQYKLV